MLVASSLHGCTKARRYPSPNDPTTKAAGALVARTSHGWSDTEATDDVPIVFVPSSSQRWPSLPKFWNLPNASGAPTAHIAQSPLGVVAALLLTPQPAVEIKVPLGLPDPTPLIPPTNPPALKKWQLGKSLFHKSLIFVKGDYLSCAKCHTPPRFTVDSRTTLQTVFNPPSLINCVFNRRQFWDGRVETLEETLVRSLADDVESSGNATQGIRHAWSGLVVRMRKSEKLKKHFKDAFGSEPTLDAAAKALATYMRTILSGDSVYDRANLVREKRDGHTLTTADFEAVLDPKAAAEIQFGQLKTNNLPKELADGWHLFRGKAGCIRCHSGPLFTDHDFHNIGIGESIIYKSKKGEGRFVRLPIGQKSMKYMGAFRTPSLRNLRQTAPYMHNGGKRTLSDVLRHYNNEIHVTVNNYLDRAFFIGEKPQSLKLPESDLKSLEFFLRSLNGEPIPRPVIGN